MKFTATVRLAGLGLLLGFLVACSEDPVTSGAPYLVSAPVVSSAPAAGGGYDVTVTLKANGPNPVLFAQVIITDASDAETWLELSNTGGTTWSGTANLSAAGDYVITDVSLHDIDAVNFGSEYYSAHYFISAPTSTTLYYLNQLHVVSFPSSVLPIHAKLSNFVITRFTLP